MSDERPFDDLPRGHFGAILADPTWKFAPIRSADTADPQSATTTSSRSRRCNAAGARGRRAGCVAVSVGHGAACSLRLDIIAGWGFNYTRFGFVLVKQTHPVSAGTGERLFHAEERRALPTGTRGKPKRYADGVASSSSHRDVSTRTSPTSERVSSSFAPGPISNSSPAARPRLDRMGRRTRQVRTRSTTPKTTSPNR